ncbi:MAG: rSAM/selenodomain-associated transferase 2 [Neolewinella sp.]
MNRSNSQFPWCSIIIPTLNEEATLRRCLEQLAVAQDEGIEIIVVDGGSNDRTVEIANAFPALKTLHCTRGRALQLNTGGKVSSGHHLWFLHADTLPPKDWRRFLKQAISVGLPASFSLRFDDHENIFLRFYAAGSRVNSSFVRFGDQSLILSKQQFLSSGGYREDLQLMEGHEFVRRLQKQAGGFQLLPASVVTSSRRYHQFGVVYTQAVFTRIYFLFYLGVSPKRLVEIYRKSFKRMGR